MKAILKRAYTAPDYMLDAAGNLLTWKCRWTFAIYLDQGGYVYEASWERAPGVPDIYRKNLPETELARNVRNIERLGTCKMFTQTAWKKPCPD